MNSTQFTTWFQNIAFEHLSQSIQQMTEIMSQHIQCCYNIECDTSVTGLPPKYLTLQAENCINSFKTNLLSQLQQACFTKQFSIEIEDPIDMPIKLNTHNTLMQRAKMTATTHALHALPQLAFLDIETDGLDIKTANILQIAIIKPIIDPLYESMSYYNTMSTYVLPWKGYSEIDNDAIKINHIGNKQLKTAITTKEALKLAANHLSHTVIVGYNVNNFDIPILQRHFEKYNLSLPHKYSIDLYPAIWKNKKQKLDDAIKYYNVPPNINPHDALGDAICCIDLLSQIIERNELPNNEDDLLELFNSEQNTWHKFGKKNIINVNPNHSDYSHFAYQTPTSSLKRKLSQTSILSRSESF